MKEHAYCILKRTSVAQLYSLVYVLMQITKCVRAVELTETVVTPIFHAVTSKG